MVAPRFDNVRVTLAPTLATVSEVTNPTADRISDTEVRLAWTPPSEVAAVTTTYTVTLTTTSTVGPPAVQVKTVTFSPGQAPQVLLPVPAGTREHTARLALTSTVGGSTTTFAFVLAAPAPPPPPEAPVRDMVLVPYAFPAGRAFARRNFGRLLEETPNGD